jgi:beta propeller repeat protein
MKTIISTTLSILLAFAFGFACSASAEHVLSPPQIANGRVVWAAYEVTDAVQPGEIYLYDIAAGTVQRLTDNALDDSSPRIDDETIVWVQTDDSGNSTWWIYDLATGVPEEAPKNFVWGDSPQVDGDLTVLTREDGEDREIVIQSESLRTVQQLTEDEFQNSYPSISGNNIAWVRGEGETAEIFLRAESGGEVETRVTENDYEDSFSQIKGNSLVWQGRVNSNWEVFLYDVSTGEEPIRVTQNPYDDTSPQTDGSHVAWLGCGHPGGEIFVYDISTGQTAQITIEGGVLNCGSGRDLADAILAMQIVSGVEQAEVCFSSDLDGDGKIGIKEVVYILQGIASMR